MCTLSLWNKTKKCSSNVINLGVGVVYVIQELLCKYVLYTERRPPCAEGKWDVFSGEAIDFTCFGLNIFLCS